MTVYASLSHRRYYARDQGELPEFLRRLFSRLPDEIVQPRTSEEAASAVCDASRAGRPVVPRGTASTAFGQVMPVRGGRMMDVCFMKAILRLDPDKALVTVQAGVRWSDLAAYLEEKGFALGSYPSSWYTTVGGWVATGGLGINSLKFGPLRGQVARLRVCLPQGEERVMGPDDPIFDAFFETEGQMGLILEVTLKVRPMPPGSYPFLVPCASWQAAWDLSGQALQEDFDFTHSSIYNAERMRHFNHTLRQKMERKALEQAGYPSPYPSPQRGEGNFGSKAFLVTFEEKPSVFFHLESQEESLRFGDWLRRQNLRPAPAYQAAYVWMERFYPLKGKRADQMFLGNEQVMPHASAAAYCRELEGLAGKADAPLAIESNAAGKERSVIIASFYAPSEDEPKYLDLLALVFEMDELGARHGGRLYHVGIYNSPFIEHRFDADTLARLRFVKRSLDPKGLFNPGKFFSMSTAWTGFVPETFQKTGARLTIRLLRTAWGRALARYVLGLGSLARTIQSYVTPAKAGVHHMDSRLRRNPEIGEKRNLVKDNIYRTMRECVNCGFCLPVCPAYLATRDERTTARGKLFLASQWLAGEKLSSEDVERLHSCMHCAGCTQVCQSALDLVPAWYELERRVAGEYGKPVPAIENFVREVEASADYRRLLRRGFISEPVPAQR